MTVAHEYQIWANEDWTEVSTFLVASRANNHIMKTDTDGRPMEMVLSFFEESDELAFQYAETYIQAVRPNGK